MNRLLHISRIVIFLLFAGLTSASGQNYFRIIGGIPHLPVMDPASVSSPTTGMLVYSSSDLRPMIYTGSAWETLCTTNISTVTPESYFVVKGGIPQVPVLNNDPVGTLKQGSVYYSTVTNSVMVFNGNIWTKMVDMETSTFPVSTGFEAGTAVKTFKLPVLNTTPAPLGMTVGAFYISSLTKTIKYYDGNVWLDVVCAPTIITLPVDQITSISARSGGDITSNGGAPITARGITWSALGDPLNDPSAIITNDGSGVGLFPSNLTNLLGNTKYYVRAYAVNKYGKAYGNLVEFTTPPPVPPVLNALLNITDITGISAVGSATVINNGGALITERGIRWTTDRVNYYYSPADGLKPEDIGAFIAKITGLSPGTTYYAQAYATNSAGTGYSSETSFVTASLVNIITAKPSGITGTTALSGGEIFNTGNSKITARGIVWSKEKDPTIDLTTKTSVSITGDGTGVFTSTLTGLDPGETYYVRAYAINSAGISYGNLDSLTTLDSATVITLSASSIFNSTATAGGNVISDGGAPVTQRGVVWSLTANPTISDSRTRDGQGLGIYSSLLTGLQPRVTYHMRAYAINSVGVSYGEDKTFEVIPEAPVIITLPIEQITSISAITGGDITSNGGAPITLRGITWSTKGDPIDDKDAVITNDGSGVGLFPSSMTALLGNTTYYVRAYAVNSFGKAYGNLLQFTTPPPVVPALSSPNFNIVDITNTTAVGEVTILNNGGSPVTARGIRYSTDHVNFIYVPSTTVNPTDIGTFIVHLSGLTPATTYYAQGYATNDVGTAYSSETSFRTTSLATLTTTPPSDITGVDAYSGGEITNTGDDVITARGVVWDTEKNPTIDLPTKTSHPIYGIGTGIFISHMTGLKSGTKYYVRAYAVNSYGTAYGNLDSLITGTTASITTIPPSGITTTTAITGGIINDDGRLTVQSRGVCWSIYPNPTTNDSYVTNGWGSGSFTSNITGLMGSTKYYVRAFAINSVGTSYGNLDSLKTAPPVLPTVVTNDVINIGGTTAVGRGNVTNEGGAEITERGICWNTTGNPTIAGEHVKSGTGKGGFSGNITGLTPVTKYYVRAYAVNSVGIVYGNEVTFTTYTIPTITTSPATSITSTSANSGGDIISDGGAIVTSSGICWNTTGNPTVYDTHTTGGVGIGNFIHGMTDLLGSTTYYIRAYAINSAGIAYGNVESFTTAPPILATVTTANTLSGDNGRIAYSGGNVISNGGSPISRTGLVWSTTAGFEPDTVMNNKVEQNGSKTFSATIPGLQPGTTYYVRAYVVNGVGKAFASNEVSFTTFNYASISTKAIEASSITSTTARSGGDIYSNGGAEVTVSGLCWSTESEPTIADSVTTNGVGIGSFTSTIRNLMGSTTYYVRAYATNSVGTAYGNEVTFVTMPPVLATIKTKKPEPTSSTTATSGGDIISNGGALVTTRGVYWSTNQGFNPDTVTLNKTAETGYFTGSFTSYLSRLTPNTVYYVRAYVVNSVGVAYGEEMSFKSPKLPTITTSYTVATGPTKATSGGQITDDGGAMISNRGVVWSTVADFNPDTVVNNRTNNGSGIGNFVSEIKGLKGNTTYYVRAYAMNIAGTSYGNVVSFITDPPQLATLTTREATYVRGTTATSGGDISDDGGEPVTTRGLVWSTNKGFRADTVTVNKTAQTGSGRGGFGVGLSGLKMGTTYYVRAYAINDVGVAYGNEISFTTLDLPSLTTMPASPSSTGYAASSGGTFISDGGSPITNQGVCWSTSPDPTVGLHTKTTYDAVNGNNFYSNLKDLQPVTKYYVRAYAVNQQGVAYGNEVSFTTPPALATITTKYVTPTSKSTASTGGDISFDGGAAVTERGVIWSKDANFNPDTVTINKTSDGTGIGSFISNVTGLDLSTRYYIRAYAVNSAGIAYGNQVDVTIFPTAPLLKTKVITDIGGSTAISGGEITSDGGAPVTSKGVAWSTKTNPTTADSKTVNGSGEDPYSSTLTGLKPNTLYYVRAYAINKIGTAYGEELSFITPAPPTLTATAPVINIIATTATSGGEITDDGRTPILARGVVWSLYSNPTIDLLTKTVDNTSTGIGPFVANMKGLTPDKTYYVRSYATNAVGTSYGSQVTFKTLPVMLPTLTTLPPTDIDSVKAVSGGDITDDGGMQVTVRGIVWDTKKDPTIALPTRTNHATGGEGIYNNTLAGLLPGTKYYVRAFATNSKGTAYGNLDSVTTMAIRPTVSNVVMSNLKMTSADGTATVITTGGDEVTGKGLYWNTTGILEPVPTPIDSTLFDTTAGTNITGTITNLLPSTKYYVWAFATNSEGTRFSASPVIFTTPTVPTLTTTKPSAITRNSATSGGSITKDGGVPVTARGVCYSTSGIPTIDSARVAHASGGTGNFSVNLIGLKEGTTYYIRAYATNSMGTGYGNLDSLTTLTVPTVTTAPAVVDSVSAVAGGKVIKDGGMPVTSRGVVWSLAKDPTVALTTKTINGSGTGIFTSNITGLSVATKYYFRAYATNSIGTGYGNLDSLITSAIRPKVSKVEIVKMTTTSADATATVLDSGGAKVTARGLVWNTTGNPTIADNIVSSDSSSIVGTIENLIEGPTYYIRAFATNDIGTGYSKEVTSFKICPSEFTVQHIAGLNGAPVDKTVTYHSVSSNLSGEARCWITQNLGAEKQAASANDATEAAAGWYWQFNRPQGSQYTTTRTPATWESSISENSDWTPANDPCNLLLGTGWRIPTRTEWVNAITNGGISYTSELKLHAAGYLANGGALYSRGGEGHYWSSTQSGTTTGWDMYFNGRQMISYGKATYAWSLRCLRDTIVKSPPSVSKVKIPADKMTYTTAIGEVSVSPDGGSKVTERGICWNTTGNPTIADHFVVDTAAGVGSFAAMLDKLVEGPTYYVRGYAKNSTGIGYSAEATTFKICPTGFEVTHIAGLNGAPVTKTVTYSSVSSNISGEARCWLTQNLGADKQAATTNDNTEAAAGWYWQFNRPQGYQYTTTRTPNDAWTPWVTSISEATDWTPANDPCNLLLGLGWRIPTATEWANASANGGTGFNSVLKLHSAGYLNNSTGAITSRGSEGYYWSSTRANNSEGRDLYNNNGIMYNHSKAYAWSIRCLRDTIVLSKPTVSNVTIPTDKMTSDSAEGSATVSSDGGLAVTARGLVWNTTGTPTVDDNIIANGTGIGSFTSVLSGLVEGPTYYVRAFATNSKGTSYSPEVSSFKICPTEFTVIHTAGLNGAPVTKTVTYHSISSNISGEARCWLTQNLGADKQATAANDVTEAAAGWYWQFNRPQGYQYTTARTPENAWTSWITSISENSDWLPANDPCNLLLGKGWRLPTRAEWTNADAPPQNWGSTADTYNSVLKLHAAGFLANNNGVLSSRGSAGYYWSSTQANNSEGWDLYTNSSTPNVYSKAYAWAVRCLRDQVVLSKPIVSNVTIPTSTMTATTAAGTATVASDGGDEVTERGLVWNTIGNPTTADNVIPEAAGIGVFTGTLTGLKEGPTYYVRAYAKNSVGTGYSPDVSSFKICPTEFEVIHTAGLNGAPVTKTVTYHSISSNISGEARCWLTQNLGADQQASSPTDNTEASAGWYWQFNRSQGYEYKSARTPQNAWTAWITSISESSDWKAANDPCNLLLGLGWRIPTASEWTKADAPPQNWGSAADTYNSVLKLHSAGYLAYNTGGIVSRGSEGYYWSSTQANSSEGRDFNSNGSAMLVHSKAYAWSVRCLRDTIVLNKPSVSNVTLPTAKMTPSTAEGTATVTSDGGAPVKARGLVWNTTGTEPTLGDSVIISAGTIGTFADVLKNLKEGPTYYVRAYATNSQGTSYSPEVSSFKICPTEFEVIHTAGLNGAPVTKTVTYHSISSNISGEARCWLTQNLGADKQATAANDATEAAAGWYWQFNRPQGYQYTTARTPQNAWTPWITSISESSDWLPANDPCNLLLGKGWRLPTRAEWTNADAPPQNWGSTADTYNSVLKLHAAGFLAYDSGVLSSRGSAGYYWSSTQANSSEGWDLYTNSSTPNVYSKAYGWAVRCLRDQIVLSKPTVSNVTIPTSTMTATTAAGTATVASDGGVEVTERGLVWNTTGNPTITDNIVKAGNGLGIFTGTLEGLAESPTYYVRAYAKNSVGIGYSPEVSSFKICPTEFEVIHTAGLNGAPVTKTVKYHSISTNISGAARCWLTQNLGADQQATSASDKTEESAGWYWQFNRLQGYEYKTARTPQNAWTPWITSISESSDWKSANDPCNLLLGLGWRIPTASEWTAADAPPQNWGSAADTYNSVLKLHSAGYLASSNGELVNRGVEGYYWSSTQANSSEGRDFNSNGSVMAVHSKAFAWTIRCLRDTIVLNKPSISNVTIPTSTMTSSTAEGTATVTSDGGTPVTARGLVWNTTGNPTTVDHVVPAGTGIDIFTSKLEGLVEGPTYYVRAFATNSEGTSYSPAVSSFKICPTEFEVIHTAGLNGAPVTKTVTYHSISSNISGEARCWLTQNLGADKQATAANDATEAAAGWYWQFNRPQGYQYTTARTPQNAWTPWITSISESSDWLPANDPCNLLLGKGWRLPTRAEWTNADAPPQNWGSTTDTYNSVLKLHAAGYLAYDNGVLAGRGSAGYYWSGSQVNSSEGLYLYTNSSTPSVASKAYGWAVRCLRDQVVLSKPTVSNVTIPTSTMTATTAAGTATVASDGGVEVTERGLVWNTTGNPTTADNKITVGSGIDVFTGTLTGLTESPTYYVRAYAENSVGTGYSPEVSSFKICPTEFEVIHTAGLNGAPATKTVKYHSISTNISGAARCWLTQNLGADQQATSAADNSEASAGWYWQFNRAQGYEYKTARTPQNAWTPWITSISESSDWLAANDPCNLLLGKGWRLPTRAEWTAADAPPQNWGSTTDTYNSVLKLHAAGYLAHDNGALVNRGSAGYYWSSTQANSSEGWYLYTNSSTPGIASKAYGWAVRCLRDQIVQTRPTVSNATIPTSTMTTNSAAVSATVSLDGGSKLIARGVVWNATGNPTIADQVITNGSELGSFTSTLTGLAEGPTYYVRAYATNGEGVTYSPEISSFKICPKDFVVAHTAGINGAPVTKTVTYSSISTDISGVAQCWLTQNLGADRQAISAADNSEISAGWYWQFNRLQGYKYDGSIRTPATPWATSISESSNWVLTNDPCDRLLGAGWRIPTQLEWTKADAPPQNWGTTNDTYNSVLKLHAAGYIEYSNGALYGRGSTGYYWSSTQNGSSQGWDIYTNSSTINVYSKAYGWALRCLKD